MLAFAVLIKDEEQGRWVLAVDSVHDKLLVTGDNQSLRWVLTADCKFLKAMTPEAPQPVVIVQPHQPVVVPQLRIGNQGNGRN